jgi:hypothetical protein
MEVFQHGIAGSGIGLDRINRGEDAVGGSKRRNEEMKAMEGQTMKTGVES